MAKKRPSESPGFDFIAGPHRLGDHTRCPHAEKTEGPIGEAENQGAEGDGRQGRDRGRATDDRRVS